MAFSVSGKHDCRRSVTKMDFTLECRCGRFLAVKVLFICTGNYYRSRFAEGFFNFHAEAKGIRATAFSRGLDINQILDGSPISPFTVKELERLGIPRGSTQPDRVALTLDDLEEADLAIALKRTEHYPMMQQQFPDWAERITYWEVHDLDVATPEQSLPQIAEQTNKLIERYNLAQAT